jgi:hypothetical protein
VRWATSTGEVPLALRLVRALDGARREVQEARDLADRLEALLRRGGGLDAFPGLQRRFAHAHAAENAAARAEGRYAQAAGVVAEKVLAVDARAELERARAARRELEARFERMPRTPEAVEERIARMHGRVDAVAQEAFQLQLVVDACGVAMIASDTWLDQHRAEVTADAESRQQFRDELRKHRDIVDGYEAELAALRQELAKARDASGGGDAVAEEARVREDYRAAVERERLAADAARATLPVADRAVLERADAARGRLADVRTRAVALEQAVASEAARRAGELRARIEEDGAALAAHDGTLDGVQGAAKDVLGRVAVKSIADVRAQFYRLVLKADVGIVDVAWSLKRQRLEKIQQLAVQKDAEVEQIDREYRTLLREVE